jgi:hypothetical protein
MITTIMMATITPPMMFAIFDFDIVDPLLATNAAACTFRAFVGARTFY